MQNCCLSAFANAVERNLRPRTRIAACGICNVDCPLCVYPGGFWESGGVALWVSDGFVCCWTPDGVRRRPLLFRSLSPPQRQFCVDPAIHGTGGKRSCLERQFCFVLVAFRGFGCRPVSRCWATKSGQQRQFGQKFRRLISATYTHVQHVPCISSPVMKGTSVHWNLYTPVTYTAEEEGKGSIDLATASLSLVVADLELAHRCLPVN